MNRPDIPGLNVTRMCRLMRDRIAATGLDLHDLTVLTEAASGAYAVTPVIAALAGARRVFAFTRSTRHGTVSEVTAWTMSLASAAGVDSQISVIESLSPEIIQSVDIVTNSGHLRPITAATIQSLPATAVIALMFEAWEFRPGDIDTAACRRRAIPIVGVNENHPSVDVFSYLGPLCVKLLQDAGLAVYCNRIALLCDNGFAEPMLRGLKGAGADASCFSNVDSIPQDSWDAVVVALRPGDEPRVGRHEAAALAKVCPHGALVAQFWGDVDREEIVASGLEMWPVAQPSAGHMAILLSAIGPEPIVRLQTGGLRAAEYIFHGGAFDKTCIAQPVDLSI